MARRASVIINPRLWVVAVVVLAVVAAALLSWFMLPAARIVITPALQKKTAEQSILLSTAAGEPDFKRFILPARVVEASAETTETVQREGGTARPARAQGVVRLINKQDEEQPLLPLSHLRHEASGVYFLTDAAVRIPPQGEITVAVTAKEEGAAGNVPAGKFVVDKLPASLQAFVFAESDTAFSGGEVFDTPLSEEELNAAKEKVAKAAEGEARGELTASAGGAVIRDDLITRARDETSASVAAGSRATSYTVTSRMGLRGFVVDDTATLSLTLLALQAKAEASEEFVGYEPNSFSLSFERADFERGEARVTGHLTGSFAQKTESTVFDTHTLAGRTPAEVQEYFKQFPSVDTVSVTLSPFWVTTVPSRAGAVEVVMEKK